MIRLWLFLHILGFTLWIGGALAAMHRPALPSLPALPENDP